jgi:hypothetical protein
MAWTANDRTSWRDLIDYLGEVLPAAKSIRVIRRSPGRDATGSTTDEGRSYTIRIRPALGFGAAVDALQEEYAHALAGVTGHVLRDHGLLWGEAYSAVTVAVLRWTADED